MSLIHTVEIDSADTESKTFECSSSESILQAGLRAGVPMRYKCTNGSCGECRSRLLSGQIEPLRSSDYPLSQQERSNGWFLSCTQAPTSSLQISAPLFSDAIEIPHQTIRTKVKKIERLHPDLAILTLRTPRSNTFQFLAGQDVVLSHLLTEHRYPIASCPCNGMELEFHIHRSESDPFSQLLFSSLNKGESVTIEGPRGHFLLNEQSQRPLVFVAWEYGFASIRSLIEHLISVEMENPVSFYWLSQHTPYQHNLAQSWKAVLDHYSYRWIQHHCNTAAPEITTLIQHIQQAHAIKESDFYIAAPAELLILLSEQLLLLGVEESRLRGSPL